MEEEIVEVKSFMLVGATVERVNMAHEVVAGEKFQWIDSLLLRSMPAMGSKLYKLTCGTDCMDDYGRMGEADFDVEEIEE